MSKQMQRSRLGRGLTSLMKSSMPVLDAPVMREVGGVQPDVIPEKTDDLAPASTPANVQNVVRLIPVGAIRPNPNQPRRQIDPDSIERLAISIRATGVIQPIIVRPAGEGFELIAGERRWRATTLAGLESVPAIVRDATAAEQAEVALIENIQREDLNPIDRANSYRVLMDQLNVTQAQLADHLGEDRSGIANYLRLLNLAEPVRDHLRNNRLTLGHAKILAGVEDILEQLRLAELTVKNDLSVRNLERLLKDTATTTPLAPAPNMPSPHLKDLEATLSRQLRMRVNVRAIGRKGGGRLTIQYASLDQFDELIQKLGATLSDI